MRTKFCSENLNERHHLEDLGKIGEDLKQRGTVWSGFIWLRPVAGLCINRVMKLRVV
jgi:hypothetical protein